MNSTNNLHFFLKAIAIGGAFFWGVAFAIGQFCVIRSPWWQGPWFPSFVGGVVVYGWVSQFYRMLQSVSQMSSTDGPNEAERVRNIVASATGPKNRAIMIQMVTALTLLILIIYVFPNYWPAPLLSLGLYYVIVPIMSRRLGQPRSQN